MEKGKTYYLFKSYSSKILNFIYFLLNWKKLKLIFWKVE